MASSVNFVCGVDKDIWLHTALRMCSIGEHTYYNLINISVTQLQMRN